MPRLLQLASVILLCLGFESTWGAEPGAELWPGPQQDGSILLPNLWSLRPVGKQVLLGDFPVSIAMHPSGRWAAVLHSGYGENEVAVLSLPGGEIVSRSPVEESFYGITFNPRGNELFCSGAGDEVIHRFEFRDGFLANHRKIALRSSLVRGIPAGIAISPDGDRLYCANLWGQSLDYVSLRGGYLLKSILLSTNSQHSIALKPAKSEDEAAITKRAEAALEEASDNDPFPYGTVLDAKRNRLYVSFWAQASVGVFDSQSGKLLDRWPVEEHPNEMLLGRRGKYLFVANANRNTVSVLDTESGKLVETLIAELRPSSAPGSTPNSLALSPDESLLFVANANVNAVAVFDVSEIGRSRSLGFIPVGWYPTSVRITPDGKHLLVANGKGVMPKANRYGPQPGREAPGALKEFIGGLLRGTVSIVELTRGEKFAEQMKAYTAAAYKGMPQSERSIAADAQSPIPVVPGAQSPIKYCVYIIKENRTYDQMLGDMKEGRGDSSLCLFDERVTPNLQ